MRKICLWTGVALLCGAGMLVGNVLAQEGGQPGGGMQMPPWMQTTDEHEALKKQVGEWDGLMHGTVPSTITAKLVFDGRYVQHDVAGKMGPMPFTGRWTMGYDTVDEEYVGIWMDSLSPVPWVGRGTEEDEVIHFVGEGVDQQTGEKITERITLEWKGDDQMLFTFYKVPDEGEDQKMGTMVYTRKK